MKNRKKFLIKVKRGGVILCLLMSLLKSNGQIENGGCGTIVIEEYERLIDCSNSSTDWVNKYRNQNTYEPNVTNEWIGLKKIPINIVVFGEDDGTGFPITPAMVNSNIQNYLWWLNYPYANPQITNFAPINPQYLSDSKIRIEINDFYFYQNSAILNNATSSVDNQAISYHLSQNPQAAEQINCYIVKNFWISGAQGHAWKYNYQGKTLPYIMSGSFYSDYTNTWLGDYGYFEGHLPHELGHVFGLNHIYNSETLNPLNIDFLDDVFSTPIQYFYGDNLMGGCTPECNNSYSPKQMGRTRRSLTTENFYNAKDFAYGYSSNPLIINNSETWDFVFKSYGNIIIKQGNS